MTNTVTKIVAAEIRTGDEFWADGYMHWKALSDARPEGGSRSVSCDVQYGDGGRGVRAWDTNTVLDVVRP